MGKILSSRYVVIEPALYTRKPARESLPIEPRKQDAAKPIDGSKQWGQLHRWALGSPGQIKGVDWLAAFRRRVPCGVCREHWDGMLVRTPPDWSELFAWTVARHNEVNVRLGKAVVDEAAARSIWAVL